MSYSQKTREGYEATFHRFLDSPDSRESLVTHCCHTRKWLYEYGQVLWVELLSDGTWNVPSPRAWSQSRSCLVVLAQVSYHVNFMVAIGESRDFEDILAQDAQEARAVAERLYENQAEMLRERSLRQFTYLRERGYVD